MLPSRAIDALLFHLDVAPADQAPAVPQLDISAYFHQGLSLQVKR